MKPKVENIDKEIRNIIEDLMLVVKTRRWSKNWTQRDLAKQIGSQQTNVTRIETCYQLPSLHSFVRICHALDLQIKLVPVDRNDPELLPFPYSINARATQKVGPVSVEAISNDRYHAEPHLQD